MFYIMRLYHNKTIKKKESVCKLFFICFFRINFINFNE